MPRTRRQIKTAGQAGDAKCKRQIREVLAYGKSVLGGPKEYGLVTRDDWGAAWVSCGDDLTAVLAGERPGLRPVACYVMGLFTMPQPIRPVPADAPGLDIVEKNGSVTRFVLHDPAVFGCPARHLLNRRVIAVEEFREHERSDYHRKVCQAGATA